MMKRLPSQRCLALSTVMGAALILAGCGSKTEAPEPTESDPALSGALSDQIMVDPQMSGNNSAAIAPNGGPVELPPQQRSPEAIQAAQMEAVQLVGGTIKPAPAPQTGSTTSLVDGAMTAARVAETAKASSADCTKAVKYSATWAAKLPQELPVYPRGAVQEAAGTDADGCHLRVVNFVSPVTPKDVIDFYFTAATKAGYGAEYRLDGTDHVIGGRKGGQAYVLYARELQNGLTEVDLIASGK